MAALFAQTLVNLSHVNAGLDREHLISIHLDFTNSAYNEDYLLALYRRMIARLKELPDVKDAPSKCALLLGASGTLPSMSLAIQKSPRS
jgi:hypothetical protein